MAYAKHRNTHKKELYYILCIVVVTLVLSFSIFGPGGYRQLRQAELELELQRARVEELERSNHERMQSIEELRSNKEALEKYARQKGYGKEGEIIHHVPGQ
ncbi:MAG: septum formation initiator family protein [Acidobacteriota bacterium]|jgi:cell division protein FtsB|nr:septum formation initiator family protein [Acidobacteriota bacterium]NLT33389.1 septum formation initiator family protein [Acidobacteriota bacterium]